MNARTIQFNSAIMRGLLSKDDHVFLKTYTNIPTNQLNDLPDKVWALIEKRLGQIPEPDKMRIIRGMEG